MSTDAAAGRIADWRRMLIVEKGSELRDQLCPMLKSVLVEKASDRRTALARIRADEPPVVLLDLGFARDDKGIAGSLRLIGDIQDYAPATKIIALSDDNARHHALAAIDRGAHDFHALPVRSPAMRFAIDRAFHLYEWEAENARLQQRSADARIPGMIGESPAMLDLYKTLERVAPADVGVLLLGDSGTGKELVARAVHKLSSRRAARFVAINCAAIPLSLLEGELFGFERGAFTGAVKQTPGKIELAEGGTLFLDEIGDLPPELQGKLLRFLQERVIERLGGRREIAVNTRVICATHRDLGRLIDEGGFRSDLYFRLCEIKIQLPALRDRNGDAVLLAQHALDAYAAGFGRPGLSFAPDAIAAIDRHDWPGNVRELQNRVKRAIIMAEGRRLSAKDLDLASANGDDTMLTIRCARERAEHSALQRALARTQGNISRAAECLGISRPTLYDLMRQHGLRD